MRKGVIRLLEGVRRSGDSGDILAASGVKVWVRELYPLLVLVNVARPMFTRRYPRSEYSAREGMGKVKCHTLYESRSRLLIVVMLGNIGGASPCR